jgi:hypothetical protein
VLLVAGAPLLVRMPLTLDAVNYDVCASTVLRGGVLYRDAFDINFPGVVWVQCAVRGLLGPRPEALRLVDLAVFGAVVALLARWVALLPRPRSLAVWTAVLLFAFYFSLTEWCHCQRDTWMLLPALAALYLRRAQVERMLDGSASPGRTALWAAGEGFVWGAAVWIKPFAVLAALGCWLAGALLVVRAPGPRLGRLLGDLLGLLLGGLAAGGLGVAWLVASGAWPAFWDIMWHWGRDYYAGQSLSQRLPSLYRRVWEDFFPWFLAVIAAVPIALAALGRAAAAPAPSRRPPSGAAPQALLAGLFLGWLAAALLLQRVWSYVYVPPVLLALTLVAGYAPPRILRPAAWLAVALFVLLAGRAHPMLTLPRLALWPRCLWEESTPELRYRLELNQQTDWVALGRVADYLRGRVGDGELTAESLGTIPLYTELGVAPSTRYVFLKAILQCFPTHAPQVRQEVAASRQRYAVTDLHELVLSREEAAALPPEGEQAAPNFALAGFRNEAPWSDPVVFRAGRYLVHQVRRAE